MAWRISAPTPLVAALHVWTFGTGLVDAISFTRFDHVFVANMTGNVVFAGLAVAGETAVAVPTVTAAVAGFILGAFAAGRVLIERVAEHRLVPLAVLVQVLLTMVAVAVASVADVVPVLAALLGAAMGAQNAVARHLKVPDATTTVVTMTVTGLAADGRQEPQRLARRLLSVLSLGTGAATGVLLLRHSLVTALAAVTLVSVTAALVALRTEGQVASHPPR